MSGMKSGNHFHVAWSRNQKDKFIAISSDVKLFEFTNQTQQQQQTVNANQQQQQTGYNNENANPGGIKILGKPDQNKQPNHFVNSRLVATGPEVSLFKAAACYPGSISEDDTLVAISCGGIQNTGKIVLVCLRPAGMYSIDNYIHVDLVAKRSVCNDVDWSYVNNSLLATGWDKHKVDNSLQIFDINRVIDTGKYSFNFSVTPNNRPVFDGCPGDSINSLKWFRKEQTVVCGLNGKQIRLYDIRDLTKPKQIVPTRAVHGLTVDSFSDKRFASYVDNNIFIWDSRFFDKPLVTITESKPISQMSWCPTRNHAFSALMSGDDFVKIYDIQQACIFSEDFEAKIVERLIHPFASSSSANSPSSGSPTTATFDQAQLTGSFNMLSTNASNIPKQITSFDWHPTNELRLIAISNHRDVIAVNICDRITLNWSPICEMVWTKGKRILQCLSPRDERYKDLDDISVNMRHRAITNYGMTVEEGPHHQRGDDSDLIGLLRWVKLAKALDIKSKQRKSQSGADYHQAAAAAISQPSDAEILGVGSLFKDPRRDSAQASRAEVKALNWRGLSSSGAGVIAPIRFQVYHSELRSRALLLCDWIPDIDNISQTIPIIDYLEREGNYMRAAATAVFNMRLQRAVDSLTMGARKSDPNLSSVAMALSGYTGERTSMWREMCQNLKDQLTNPYMKAMFAFLTSDSDTDFHEIIYDTNLILADRVAFSLLYLPDDKLYAYLTETMTTLVDSGDLTGILLTGITNDGLSLLQRYIEISSDIQSVSLIVLHSLPSAICNDARAQLWVECYRSMLDCWRLWHQRARFDNLWYSNSPAQVKPPNHILISCNYCGNTINKSQQQPAQVIQNSQAQPQSLGLTSSSGTHSPSTTSNSAAEQQAGVVGTGASGTSGSDSQGHLAVSNPVSIVSNAAASPTMAPNSGSSVGAILDATSSPQQPSGLAFSSAMRPSMTQMSSVSSSSGPPTATGRTKSSANCKKCSYAKCCLCLTQLGSNQILFEHKHSNQFNSKLRLNGLTEGLPSSQHHHQQHLAGNQRLAPNVQKTSPFSNWFSWCQTCRHGAHSAHLLSWFSENSECPVSGCDCKCMNLDSLTKLDDVQRI